MSSVDRRTAIGAAALAALATVAGTNNAQSAEQPSDEKVAEERKRVIACGLTEGEAECWILASKAAATFFELPKLHPMDEQEVAQAIHVLQNKLLARPAYRKYQGMLGK
jgi:hypothetical protein